MTVRAAPERGMSADGDSAPGGSHTGTHCTNHADTPHQLKE